jgi:hypothetical protein
MALPRLNENPEYELTIPSTQKSVRYRPFLVKEQKNLLIAYESKDQSQIISSILNCIGSCIQEETDVSKLSTFDTDYIFTKIRSKSVGEKVTVSGTCQACQAKSDVEVDLDMIKLEGELKPQKIELTSDIHLDMKYPTYKDFISSDTIMEMNTNSIFEMLTTCIKSVRTEEENINLADEPKEEIERFVNSLTGEQFQRIQTFIENVPKITLDIEFDCKACNVHNKHKLEGLQDFFS